tara:strand:- start:18 stop:509 length:492 start_codon:yes stop_codon:yes gene_type:complete
MEWHETNNEKSRLKRQKTFYKGKLISLCDWHNNGQQSLEAAYTNGQLQWQKRWNKDGELILTTSEANATVSSDASSNQKPLPVKSPPTVGRRTIWEKNRLNAIYSGKPLETVRVVFGPPDHKLGNTWIYSNLRIIDSKNLQRYTTAHFLIQHKKVLGVDVLFN